MSNDHTHVDVVTAAAAHRRPLMIALGLTAAYMVVEVVVGLAIGSLALVSDAGHMLTDVAGLGMALAAIQLARTQRSPSATYGLYRLEVVAALANAVLLFAVAGYVIFEAWRRLSDPADVPGAWLLGVAAVGLAVNVASFMLLRRGASESMNLRGAFLEVFSDMLGSVGVIVAGLILLTTGWPYVDAVVGVAIGLFILPRAYRLGREALGVLLEVAPAEVDMNDLRTRLATVPGVAGVHDLHVWTLTSGIRVATGHVDLDVGAEPEVVRGEAQRLLSNKFEIRHVTLQLEPAGSPDHGPMVV